MPNHCCVKPGQTCFENLDCCGGDSPAQCYYGTCCVSTTYPCTRDIECCGVACRNGRCGG